MLMTKKTKNHALNVLIPWLSLRLSVSAGKKDSEFQPNHSPDCEDARG